MCARARARATRTRAKYEPALTLTNNYFIFVPDSVLATDMIYWLFFSFQLKDFDEALMNNNVLNTLSMKNSSVFWAYSEKWIACSMIIFITWL